MAYTGDCGASGLSVQVHILREQLRRQRQRYRIILALAVAYLGLKAVTKALRRKR
jgi:hypothetical protein